MDKYSEVIHTANISNLDKVTGLARAKRNRHQADWTPKQDEQKYKSNKGKLSSIGLRYRYCTISSACLDFVMDSLLTNRLFVLKMFHGSLFILTVL